MGEWQEDKLQELRFLDSDRTMFMKIAKWSEELGFEYCTFAVRTPLPVSKAQTFAISNYPEDWLSSYQCNNFVSIDPVVRHSMCSQEMLVWSDNLFADVPEFWQSAKTAGLRFGLTQPTRGNHGVAGLLSLARSSDSITSSELDESKFKLAWLAQIAHQGMSKYLISDSMPATGENLSKREISVLRWIAEGKTSNDIAEILGISERTVNFHINNAVSKLGTANRTAAAVRAALLGLL